MLGDDVVDSSLSALCFEVRFLFGDRSSLSLPPSRLRGRLCLELSSSESLLSRDRPRLVFFLLDALSSGCCLAANFDSFFDIVTKGVVFALSVQSCEA